MAVYRLIWLQRSRKTRIEPHTQQKDGIIFSMFNYSNKAIFNGRCFTRLLLKHSTVKDHTSAVRLVFILFNILTSRTKSARLLPAAATPSCCQMRGDWL